MANVAHREYGLTKKIESFYAQDAVKRNAIRLERVEERRKLRKAECETRKVQDAAARDTIASAREERRIKSELLRSDYQGEKISVKKDFQQSFLEMYKMWKQECKRLEREGRNEELAMLNEQHEKKTEELKVECDGILRGMRETLDAALAALKEEKHSLTDSVKKEMLERRQVAAVGKPKIAKTVGSPPPLMPKEQAVACLRCERKFSLFRRRHHCRACGNVFCDDCTNHRALLPMYGLGEEKVCTRCAKYLNHKKHAAPPTVVGTTPNSETLLLIQ
jgi:hypothetical protein